MRSTLHTSQGARKKNLFATKCPDTHLLNPLGTTLKPRQMRAASSRSNGLLKGKSVEKDIIATVPLKSLSFNSLTDESSSDHFASKGLPIKETHSLMKVGKQSEGKPTTAMQRKLFNLIKGQNATKNIRYMTKMNR